MKRALLFRDYSCQALFNDDDFIFLYAGCSRFTYVSADGVVVVNQFTCFATHSGSDSYERTDAYRISSWMSDGRKTSDIDIKRKLLIVIEFVNQHMERPYLVHNLLSDTQKQSLIKVMACMFHLIPLNGNTSHLISLHRRQFILIEQYGEQMPYLAIVQVLMEFKMRFASMKTDLLSFSLSATTQACCSIPAGKPFR